MKALIFVVVMFTPLVLVWSNDMNPISLSHCVPNQEGELSSVSGRQRILRRAGRAASVKHVHNTEASFRPGVTNGVPAGTMSPVKAI